MAFTIDFFIRSLFDSSLNSSLYVFDTSVKFNCHHQNVNIKIGISIMGAIVKYISCAHIGEGDPKI